MKLLLLPLLYLSLTATTNMISEKKRVTSVGYFKSPPPSDERSTDSSQNLQWDLGSTQVIKWGWLGTPWPQYTLYLYQYGGGTRKVRAQIYAKQPGANEVGNYTWVVHSDPFNIEAINMFHFGIIENGTNSGEEFISHDFNITKPKPATSSLVPPTASPSSIISTNPSSSTSSPLPPTIDPNMIFQSPAKGSDHLPIALGVGLGVGIPLVLFLGILVGLRVVRARTARPEVEVTPQYVAPGYPPDVKYEEPAPMYQEVQQIHEVHEDVAPAELPSPVPQNFRLSYM